MTIDPALWDSLIAELDLWAAAGHEAVFWWRDDDATIPTPALEQLLALRARTAIPLALAVIPEQANSDLVHRLREIPGVAALQHGYAHRNHAKLGEKKSEFPATRPLSERLDDIRRGQALMTARFGNAACCQPIFVPPWNRIATDMQPLLAGLGFTAISGFKPRAKYWAAPGLVWLNTQLDPIDWHGNNHSAAASACVEAAAQLLLAMRCNETPLQPVGFLTHHLRHDDFLWAFIAEFLVRLARHPACRWVDPMTALASGRPAPPVTPAS